MANFEMSSDILTPSQYWNRLFAMRRLMTTNSLAIETVHPF